MSHKDVNNTASKPRHPLAMGLLAMALLLVCIALWASHSQRNNTGPNALAANADHVWLGVNDEVWVLSPTGQLQTRWPMADKGFPRGVAQIRWMSPTQTAALGWDQTDLMVSSRFSGRLDRLSTQGEPLGHIRLQWPEALAHAGQDATYFAVSDTGKIALTTGGDHAVALFDRSGRFLIQSPAGSFVFTNGIFWTPEGFWVTDTNRSELVLLDTDTLAVKQRVTLSKGRFLGDLVASPQGLATVTQLRNGMRYGHISDVMPNGKTVDWALPQGLSVLEPRSLLWHGSTLLVADGETGSVLAAQTSSTPPLPWGDAKVQAQLGELKAAKDRAQRIHKLGLGGGIVLLIAALLLLRKRQQTTEQNQLSQVQHHIHPDLLAKVQRYPNAKSRKEFAKAMLPFMLPAMAATVVIVMITTLAHVVLRALQANPLLTTYLPLLPVLLSAWLFLVLHVRHMRKLAALPELEEHFNQHAYRNLLKPNLFWAIQQPDELVLESVTGFAKGKHPRHSQWWVLTNQRLLIWQGSLLQDAASLKLLGQWPLNDILRQGARPPQTGSLRAWLFPEVGLTLGIGVRQGHTQKCCITAVPAAQHLLNILKRMPAPTPVNPTMASSTAPQAQHPRLHTAGRTKQNNPQAPRPSSALSPALASLLIPGWGHAMQQRKTLALSLFVIAGLTWVGAALPLLWTWWHQSAAIPVPTLLQIMILVLGLHGLAGWDAKRHGQAAFRPKPR